MNSLRPLILITPCYYSPVVMDMFTYFVSLELSCNYTKVENKNINLIKIFDICIKSSNFSNNLNTIPILQLILHESYYIYNGRQKKLAII
jgi:hypothetical protein